MVGGLPPSVAAPTMGAPPPPPLPPSVPVPTRRSMRMEVAAPVLPSPAPVRPPHAVLAPPVKPQVKAPSVKAPSVKAPALMPPPENVIQPPPAPPRPILGPIGFLLLGATVAVVCFLAVQTLLK
jgi:hypothetical protein